MNDNNVIDLKSRTVKASEQPKPSKYEFHFHPSGEVDLNGGIIPGEIVEGEGFLKFGPQFVVVVETPDDNSPVILVVSTRVIQYIKRIGSDNEIQATLSL